MLGALSASVIFIGGVAAWALSLALRNHAVIGRVNQATAQAFDNMCRRMNDIDEKCAELDNDLGMLEAEVNGGTRPAVH